MSTVIIPSVDLGNDDAARSLHTDGGLIGQPLIKHEARETTCAVAALFHFAAIGVENTIAKIRVWGSRALHEGGSGRSRSEMAVGNEAQLLCRGSIDWRMPSIMTKSLP
jgi:hypothetical protein